MAGIFCDAVRSANDELQHQFEVCFFDLEMAKEDLRDLGYENDLDMVVDNANYYRKYQSEFKNLSDTFWALFLKPTIWEYMNKEENKNLQKHYRACELKYLDYVSNASAYNGELYLYCAKHQKENLSDCELRNVFVEFLKRGQKQWMPSGCEGLRFAWEQIEQASKVVPTFDDNYSDPQDADLLQGVDGEVGDEYLSLMSFPGNQDRLRELLKQGETVEKDADRDATDNVPPRSLTIKVGGVNLSCPRIGSMRVAHGGDGRAMTGKKQRAMKARGIEAERCVEAWLRNQPGNNHVEGRSGTSRTSGRNDSLHYDISYVNGGKTYYVEVKACDSGEFHISAGELEFARQNTETYRLALVYLESQQLQLIDDVYNRVKDVKVAEDWKVAVN